MSDDADKATILKHAGGSESDAWNEYIGSQALASIRPYIGDEEKRDKMRAVVTAGLTGIAPRDEMEGMIAAQMIACHDTAMGCFRDALAAKKPSRLFRDYLNQAGKLSRTFAMLLDALNRHRGKGMQKITVEHVHVHSGGQAVVGVVEAPGGGVQPKSEDQPHGSRTTSLGNGGSGVNPKSACNHGTFVMGLLGARRDAWIPGICPDCQLLHVPLFMNEDAPQASVVKLANAIMVAVKAGARLISSPDLRPR